MKKNLKLLVATLALSVFGLSACQQSGNTGPSTDSNARKVTAVELDESNIEKEIGETFTLTAVISYRDDVEVAVQTSWKSSNVKVAEVDQNGVVTTKAAGKANIVFIAGNKMAVCEVVVKGNEPEPEPTPTPTPTPEDPEAPSLVLSTSSKTLKPGESFVLSATIQNISGGIAWANQNPEIATMAEQGDSVTISAKAEGQTVITATIGDLIQNCTVKVIAEEQGGGGEEEEDEDKSCSVYFFIDFNNADEKDETGTKLLKEFKWYTDRPLKDSGLVPANPTTALDPAFPYFLGWSSHPIIDNKSDLWNLDTDVTGNRGFIYIYGIWADSQI